MGARVIDDLEGLRALRPAWERLERAASWPTQNYVWMEACAEALAAPGELRVVAVEEGGELVAVAPLIQRKGTRGLELLGLAELQEPTDALYADAAAARRLADAVLRLRLPLLLSRFPESSLFLPALKAACRGRGVALLRPAASCPALVLEPSSVDQPDKILNSGRRSDLRRAQRKAEELGPVACEVLSPSPEEARRLLEEAIAIEAASWKGQARSALAIDAVRRGFYERFTAAASAKGILRLCFLRIGGKPAAMQTAVETAGRLWLFKIGYDEAFARCSPGNLLLREVIRDSARRGLKSVEFLGVCEPWLKMWTSRETACLTLRAYPAGAAGAARLAKDLIDTGLKKLPKRFFRSR